MKIVLIVVAVIVFVLIIKARFSGDKPKQGPSRPSADKKPTVEKENDKIILVNNASHEDIKKALMAFCNQYNENGFAALPRLWQLSPNSFAVTFPYDIDFVTYCFAVNYLDYPTDIKWNAKVRAWATSKPGDDWIPEESINKKLMLFIAVDDKEYDNVFATTQDNIGYKLSFSGIGKRRPLADPKEKYQEPAFSASSLKDKAYEDIE